MNVSSPRIWRLDHSFASLPQDQPLRRQPRAQNRKRSSAFMAQFENRALFYDCFWHHDGERVLLAGPPSLNLQSQYAKAQFTAQPSGQKLNPRYFPSRSTMATELKSVPAGTTHIDLVFDGHRFELPVQLSLVHELAGARILFTMNKDNELGWIEEWAHYHVAMHGTNCIVLFDNGSSKYDLDELEKMLAQVPGLKNIVLCDWQHRFGARDSKVFSYPYWAHFLQITSMNMVIRRLGMRAEGILNCDIDELAAPVPSGTVYQLASDSQYGIVALAGQWVSAAREKGTGEMYRHRDFEYARRDFSRNLCPLKWVLAPRQAWVEQLDVFPYWHRLMNAPDRKITDKPLGTFWHFRGISSGWKSTQRSKARLNHLLHKHDKPLRAAMSQYKLKRAATD